MLLLLFAEILKMLTPVLQTMISIFLIKQIDYFLQLLKNAVASKTPAAAAVSISIINYRVASFSARVVIMKVADCEGFILKCDQAENGV